MAAPPSVTGKVADREQKRAFVADPDLNERFAQWVVLYLADQPSV
jgi:hypothetical protein